MLYMNIDFLCIAAHKGLYAPMGLGILICEKDIENTIKDAGENASFEAGVFNLHPELIKILGRLKYRTSYGQNVLKHSLETSYIAGLLAGELGANVTLDYDDFIAVSGIKTTPAFFIVGSMNGQGQMMCVPYNYRGVEKNFNYKITINEFPQCGYTLDSYRAWLAGGGDLKQQTALLQGIGNGIFSLLGMAQSVNSEYSKQWDKNYDYRYQNYSSPVAQQYADKNTNWAEATAESGVLAGAGGLLSGILNAAVDYKTTEYNSKAQANIPVGMTAGNAMIGLRELNFRCYDVDINQQDAKIIDDFFDKYGYQVNKLKVPNISGRKQWNYVKTRECEIVGNIPASTKSSIINIFNNGITFWKHGDNIGNYSLDNTL